MENGDRKRRSGAIVSRFSQLYFFSSDHPRKDASVWTLAVTPAHKCSFSRPRGIRGRAATEYLWSSRHFSRAPAAAGATPVQRPRFRRSRSGKHVAETPSYCRYQARFLYKPRAARNSSVGREVVGCPCLVGQRRNGATTGVHFTLGDRRGFDQTTVVANFVTSCPRSATRLRFEEKEEGIEREDRTREIRIFFLQIAFFLNSPPREEH